MIAGLVALAIALPLALLAGWAETRRLHRQARLDMARRRHPSSRGRR